MTGRQPPRQAQQIRRTAYPIALVLLLGLESIAYGAMREYHVRPWTCALIVALTSLVLALFAVAAVEDLT